MNEHRLRILSRAQADVDAIYSWLLPRSIQGAQAWYVAFETASENLLFNPAGCALAVENELVDYELRQFLFKTRRGRMYRGLFTIVGNEVRILRVRGPGQRDLTADELELTDR